MSEIYIILIIGMTNIFINLRFHHKKKFQLDQELKFIGWEIKVYNNVDVD